MDVNDAWMTQRQPTPPEDPAPEGEESERVGIDDGEADTERSPGQRPRPIAPEPATPDANPIDPRVFRRS